MSLWFAGSTTAILKEMFAGREEVINQKKLWQRGAGKAAKGVSLRGAAYTPYASTEEELRAAVVEIECGGRELGKGGKKEGLDADAVSDVVGKLRVLTREELVARVGALKEETLVKWGHVGGDDT